MGKILKYCGSCEEGFAERFTFCPDCGGSLQAVEVNPVASVNKQEVSEQPVSQPFVAEPESYLPVSEPVPNTEPLELSDVRSDDHGSIGNAYETGPLDLPGDGVVETASNDASENYGSDSEEESAEVFEPAKPAAAPVYYTTPEVHADEIRRPTVTREEDGGFYVTVIQEDNTKQRNVLLMGATFLVLFVLASVVLIDLFTKDLSLDAIDDNPLFSAVLTEEIPMPVDEAEEPEKNDEEDGGGGGGGKEEQTPASKGDLPDFAKNPSRPPDVNTPRMENPSLPIPPPQLQANVPMRTPKDYGTWGVPNGADGPPSNGPGTGGGIGSGSGQGVGPGSGGGAGPGSGGGAGGGAGGGFGPGNGGGGAPPAIRPPVTENYRILSKPKATYTDAARTNNVQGSVRLKVALLASGQVGSITPVTRLPHGLTEQAIAAARRINFTPKKVNGVSQTVVVTLEYGFNIY